jgi:tRNA1(Val) A37 N6-methylase TrmN6
MRDLPDASFDLVVCNGPYAVTTHECPLHLCSA